MFGPYAQISDAEQGYFSEMPDIHNLDIEMFGPYAQMYDAEQGDF